VEVAVFSEFRTAQLEVAPFRARLVWADAIDDYLAGRDEPALGRVRDVLRDPDVVVARDDLLRVRAFLISTVGQEPADAAAAERGARQLVEAFGTEADAEAGPRWPSA
jgi:hypothetical protein